MSTIKRLSSIDSVAAGDTVALYDVSNGDDRRAAFSAVATYVQSALTIPTDISFTRQDSVPTAGSTVTVTDGDDDDENVWLLLAPAATLATLTIKLPAVASLVNNQEILIFTTQAVTTLTIDVNGATSVVAGPSTLTANQAFRLKYNSTTTNWYNVDTIYSDLADLTLTDSTASDADEARESDLSYKGTQSGGELTTLAKVTANHDGSADDEKGNLIFKTNAGSDSNAPTERVRIDSAGNVGIGDSNPSTQVEVTGATPYLTLHNDTNEDTDGGRESRIDFKGEQSGDEESTLARIQASHDGASDDEKGDLIFYTNDGNDVNSPTERLRIDSAGLATFAGALTTGGTTTVGGALVLATTTVTATGPTDDLDVSGVNVVFIDTSSNNVTLGAFTGGVSGQKVHVVVINATNNSVLEHNEATANQNIFLRAGADETLTASYGGWTLVCNGTSWFECD